MTIMEIIVLVCAVLLNFAVIFSQRSRIRRGDSFQMMMGSLNGSMLLPVSIVVLLAFGWSPLHLLWMLPVSHMIGLLSIPVLLPFIPLRFLSLPGMVFERICSIGLNHDTIEYNRQLIQQRLVRAREYQAQGASVKEAYERAIRETPLRDDRKR